jgi:protein SCO1/2
MTSTARPSEGTARVGAAGAAGAAAAPLESVLPQPARNKAAKTAANDASEDRVFMIYAPPYRAAAIHALIWIKALRTKRVYHRRMNLRLLALALLLVSSAQLSLTSHAAEKTFDVTGLIKARLDDGALVIQHEEIPGYMAAMTMRFTPADPREAAALQPGDRVRFRYRVSGDNDLADRFVVTGKEELKPAANTARTRRVKRGDTIPAFSLIDENGNAVTHNSLRGRFTVVTFIFTRCPVPEFCPAMALKYGALQKTIAADPALSARVRLLSITLDPEFDRPEILTEYGKAIGAKSELWNFATGEKSETDALARAFAVYAERNGVTLDHTLCTALIGPDGRVIDLWRGNAWSNDETLAALRNAAQL